MVCAAILEFTFNFPKGYEALDYCIFPERQKEGSIRSVYYHRRKGRLKYGSFTGFVVKFRRGL